MTSPMVRRILHRTSALRDSHADTGNAASLPSSWPDATMAVNHPRRIVAPRHTAYKAPWSRDERKGRLGDAGGAGDGRRHGMVGGRRRKEAWHGGGQEAVTLWGRSDCSGTHAPEAHEGHNGSSESASRRTLASMRSAVSNPSVNQLYTGANRSEASCVFRCCRQSLARPPLLLQLAVPRPWRGEPPESPA
jgi:hypothetical protein